MFSFRTTALAAAPLLLALVPTAAQAEVTISGHADLVSDYRFRGVSFSNLDPAVQAGISVESDTGLYVSVWGSSIAEYYGSTAEVDVTLGYTRDIAGLTTSVGVNTYNYPGSDNTFLYEFFGEVALPLGPVEAAVGLNWSPDQSNLDRSNRYVYGALSAAVPSTPITLTATLGHERGSYVADEFESTTSKLDWSLGASINISSLSFSVTYIGNDLPRYQIPGSDYRYNELAKDAVVFGVSASF